MQCGRKGAALQQSVCPACPRPSYLPQCRRSTRSGTVSHRQLKRGRRADPTKDCQCLQAFDRKVTMGPPAELRRPDRGLVPPIVPEAGTNWLKCMGGTRPAARAVVWLKTLHSSTSDQRRLRQPRPSQKPRCSLHTDPYPHGASQNNRHRRLTYWRSARHHPLCLSYLQLQHLCPNFRAFRRAGWSYTAFLRLCQNFQVRFHLVVQSWTHLLQMLSGRPDTQQPNIVSRSSNHPSHQPITTFQTCLRPAILSAHPQSPNSKVTPCPMLRPQLITILLSSRPPNAPQSRPGYG